MKLNPWQLALARGKTLYDWQIESLEAFGRGYPTALATCNGAGKTTVIAGAAVDWFFTKHPKGWLVATSSSFRQLQNQTWPALACSLPPTFEVMRASSPLRIYSPGGGEGVGFSTKDPGKAEGWHPKVDNTVDPVMILVDEGKTVPDAIWSAFDRCSVTYFLAISSPGAPTGRFYDCFHSLKKYYWTKQVPSTLCPHIPEWKRTRDKEIHGADSPHYLSSHEAQFSFDSQCLIINPGALQAAITLQPPIKETEGATVAFFDFAAGRDENVFALRKGNKIRIVEAWVQRDTVQAVRKFIQLAKQLGVKPNQCWGDADGLGGPMCNQFRDEKFPINEFRGGTRPNNPDKYSNLISEVWVEGARKIQRGDFNIGELDPKTKLQLCSRMLQWDQNGKMRAERKTDMLKRGLKSPDRADAILGASMCGDHMTTLRASDIIVPTTNSGTNWLNNGIITW